MAKVVLWVLFNLLHKINRVPMGYGVVISLEISGLGTARTKGAE